MTTSESRHDDPTHDETANGDSYDRDAPLPEDTDGLSDEEIAAELEGDELDSLRRERDEAVNARQRALADFVNLQRRTRESEQRARTMGVAQLARALMPVLDQFEYALGDQSANASADDLRDGVRLVRSELAKALEQNGVKPIAPEVGEEFDPTRHEAMMRQPAEGIAPNHLTGIVQLGFALDELVLRPAKVMVAPSEEA